MKQYPIKYTLIKQFKKYCKVALPGVGLKRFETVLDYYLASSGKRFETVPDYLLISHSLELFETIRIFCQGELANCETVSDGFGLLPRK